MAYSIQQAAIPPDIGGASSPRVEETGGVYRALNSFTNELIKSRARFDGDLDRLLILLVFMLGRMEAMQRSGARRRIEGLNALSIADITGLPRETARRKLLSLVESGELLRGPDGLYSCCSDLDSLIADVEPLLGRRFS